MQSPWPNAVDVSLFLTHKVHRNKMSESTDKSTSGQERGYKIKAGLFLATAGGIGLLAGFSGALATVKKQDPQSFDKVC